MSKSCQICGGLVFAGNEVLGYAGPICSGHPQATVIVQQAPSSGEPPAEVKLAPTSEQLLRENLRNVRDAGAIDDNMGGEDWTASDLAIEKAMSAIKDWVEGVIGEDEKQEWDTDFTMCRNCEFQLTDDTQDCICHQRNTLRNEQRAKLANGGER